MDDKTRYNLSDKYGVPKEEISCPSCGREYGHHNTKVDPLTELCGSCAVKERIDRSCFVSAEDFIRNFLKIR